MRPRSRKCLLADLLVQDDPTNAGSSTEGGLPRRPEPSEEPPLNSRITEGARLGGGITYTLCFDGQETPLSPHPSALAPESALQHLLPVVAECDAIQTQKHLLRKCLARGVCMNAGTVLFDHAATWQTDPTKGAAAGRVAGCNPGAGTSALDEAGGRNGREEGGRKGGTR